MKNLTSQQFDILLDLTLIKLSLEFEVKLLRKLKARQEAGDVLAEMDINISRMRKRKIEEEYEKIKEKIKLL